MRIAALLAVCWIIAGLSGAGAQDRLAQLTEDRINREPMVVFVAEGPPNACGPGCNRWFAAEGNFDRGSARRLREFLYHRTNMRLPIYFHSTGGLVGEAVEIGRLLRELRMTAGVGRSALQRCPGSATSKDCRRLLETSEDRSAQLRFAEGICGSACVYALIGASRRTVDPQARIGVHATRVVRLDDGSKAVVDPAKLAYEMRVRHDRAQQELLRYAAEMGVDPGLIDLAYKVSPNSIRLLSRAELDRLGIVSKPHYETPWLARDETPKTAYTLFKVVSRRAPPTDEQLTTTIGLTCYARDRVTLFIQRELAPNENGHEPFVRIKSDDTEVWASANKKNTNARLDFRSETVQFEAVLKATPKRSLEYSEAYEAQWVERSASIKLSFDGLEAALKTMQRDCQRIHAN
jgi:hypothetical protein